MLGKAGGGEVTAEFKGFVGSLGDLGGGGMGTVLALIGTGLHQKRGKQSHSAHINVGAQAANP